MGPAGPRGPAGEPAPSRAAYLDGMDTSGVAAGSAMRFNGSSSWVGASSEDSFEQLVGLVFKTPNEIFLAGSIVTGLDGVQPGQVYYLGAQGNLTSEVPASGYVVVLGKGIGEGVLLFDPHLPVAPQAFMAMRQGAPEVTATGW